MIILSTTGWDDYELLDSGQEERLERFGPYTLVRPDPQAIWQPHLSEDKWKQAHARFEKNSDEKGIWKFREKLPEQWPMRYKNLSFLVKLSGFKHTGVFPEQIQQWDWIQDKIHAANRPTHVLNLFAYTGIASLAAAQAGAKVTHVDASRPAIAWAKENQAASKLPNDSIRWILDDALKFTKREVRRGVKYDGIIMDPPIYGHGPKGELWKFHESFPKLLATCRELLSENSLFIIINAYAISASAIMLENVLNDYVKDLGGQIESGELALQEKDSQRLLSTGIFARWEK